MQRFFVQHRNSARRISAHRQTWFSSNSITMSAHDKKNTEAHMLNSDAQAASRWKDDYSSQRASISIYDLVDAENVRARSIAGAVDADDIDLAKKLSKEDAPIKIINELLRLSNIPIVITVLAAEQVTASKSGSAPYSISQLSDGERNALLIAADVLTVKSGTLLLIDEPERHLHRSIISPLLTLLFARRKDCAFVVSTHDVMLPLDNPQSRTLLLRSCVYIGDDPSSWDADLVATDSDIGDDLKKDILGARRKVVFVEGEEHSLDKPLYSLIFPHVSVIAKASSRNVEHSVYGIRDAVGLHWLHAFGIVDNDSRIQADIDQLRARGVYAVPVHSVESIYYDLELQKRVAERFSAVTGAKVGELLEKAKLAALESLAPHIQRLSERVVEVSLRAELMRQLPRRQDIAAAETITVTIDVPSVVANEITRFNDAIETQDLAAIIARYPVRETPALDKIIQCLGFQNREQYEGAVQKLLMDDLTVLQYVQSLFGTLAADIATA
jgi:AAA domain, putative AbiEii toxin, Type IV TA system